MIPTEQKVKLMDKKNMFLGMILAVFLTVAVISGCSQEKKYVPPGDSQEVENTMNQPTDTNDNIQWLDDWIAQKLSAPVENPPASIMQCKYQGETVYYTSAPCCDQFSTLYNAQGEVICSPDGGFIGQGDGKCPDFVSAMEEVMATCTIVWQDVRTGDETGTDEELLCTADAKLCSDGSYVGRNSEYGCAFNPCPEEALETSPATACSTDDDCWCKVFTGAEFAPGKMPATCNMDTKTCQQCYYR